MQQLQNEEPSAEVVFSYHKKEPRTEETLCQESNQQENLLVHLTEQHQTTQHHAEQWQVNKLLVTLKRHARLQKVLRWGGTVLGLSTLLALSMCYLGFFFPDLGTLGFQLAPFKQTVPSTPEMNEAFQRAWEAANPSWGGTVRVLPGTATYVDLWTPALLMLGCFLLRGLSQWQRGKLSRTLAKYDNLRIVGALAQSLEIKDKRTVSAAATALIRLLPQMQSTDAERFTASQRACLHRALQGKNAELIHAILKSFEQIGGESDIPAVMRLAQAQTGSKVAPGIQQAANDCLEFLRQKIDNDKARQSLLRAAERENSPATHLLRPAHGLEESQREEQLLRPSAA